MTVHHILPPGVRRSDPEKLALLLPARLHPAIAHRLGAPLALESDLTAAEPPVMDQGQSSACAAHEGVVVAHASLRLAGVDDPIIGSPHVLYSVSGRIERPTGELQDDGRQLVDVLTALRTVGMSPIQAPTPDGRYSDVWTAADVAGIDGAPPPNVCLDATPEELAACHNHAHDFGNHTIDPRDPDLEALVISTLTGPVPAEILIGTEVGAAFEMLAAGGLAQPDLIPNDPQGGGHALRICGHKTLADGTRLYKIGNSWSASWCSAGYCWAPVSFLRACWELHPMTATPKGPNPALSLLDRIRAALAAVTAAL